MHYSQVMIELTRTCNMKCSHCIRGASQKEKLNKETFIKFLENMEVESIESISFTGGEPSLEHEMISFIADELERRNISIGSFYIATNGVVPNVGGFMASLAKLYAISDEKDMCSVSISRDDYHLESGMATAEEVLSAFKFVQVETFSEYYLFNDGFAKDHPMATKTYDPADTYTSIYNDVIQTDEPIYLSVNGGIGIGCNFSYDRFDNELKFTNIDNIKNSEDFKETLIKYANEIGMEIEVD